MDRRFAQVDQHFEQIERRFEQMDRCFDAMHEEILNLTRNVANIDGKLDVLLTHVVDLKDGARMSMRVDNLEKQVSHIVQRLDQFSPAPHPA